MKIVRKHADDGLSQSVLLIETSLSHSSMLLAEIAEYAERAPYLDFSSWFAPCASSHEPIFATPSEFIGMPANEGGARNA
jgi:hypothetical protein